MRIAHFSNLEGVGGIERNLFTLAKRHAGRGDWRHYLVNDSRRIHPALQDETTRWLDGWHSIKHYGPLKIPSRPAALRRGLNARRLEHWRADHVLLWQWFGDMRRVAIARSAGLGVHYWERGLAWGRGGDETTEFLRSIDGVLCNSKASARMLELRWGFDGEPHLIHNTVEIPSDAAARTLSRGAGTPAVPLRLGVASRLRSFKGISLAIRAVAMLRDSGMRTTLDIAGDGPDEANLRSQASRYGVADEVRFLGVVADMSEFYRDLDILLHPTLREPFGLVLAEAMVRGVPPVTSCVDGIPEVVGEAGCVLDPTLPLDRFHEFGGDRSDVHDLVYDPRSDAVVEPSFVDPEEIAGAVEHLVRTPSKYESASRAGVARVVREFHPDRYIDRFEAIMEEAARR